MSFGLIGRLEPDGLELGALQELRGGDVVGIVILGERMKAAGPIKARGEFAAEHFVARPLMNGEREHQDAFPIVGLAIGVNDEPFDGFADVEVADGAQDAAQFGGAERIQADAAAIAGCDGFAVAGIDLDVTDAIPCLERNQPAKEAGGVIQQAIAGAQVGLRDEVHAPKSFPQDHRKKYKIQ